MRTGSQLAYEVTIEEGHRVLARDGIHLATDVYRPAVGGEAVAGPLPTIVERTPYGRTRFDFHRTGLYFAGRGYNYVVQDCRGRFQSAGEFPFFTGEHNIEGFDGYDTLQWVSAQPWSTDKVGTTGQSYGALTQQALAVTRPPYLAAQVHIEGPYNFWRRMLREGGAFGQGFFFAWAINMAITSHEASRDAAVQAELRKGLDNLDHWVTQSLTPGSSPLSLVPRYEAWYLALATRGDYETFWRNPACSMEAHIDEYPDVPTFLIASWYGIDAWGNFEKYKHLQGRCRARHRVRLLCGPWVHDVGFSEISWAGEADFGRRAALNIFDEQLRWFDHWLKGLGTELSQDPPIRFFVMGAGDGRRQPGSDRVSHGGEWRGAREWPLSGTEQVSYYLHPDYKLCRGPADDPTAATRYLFDPAKPVPTVGSAMPPVPGNWSAAAPKLFDAGAYDQHCRPELPFCSDGLPLAVRPDVLSFRSEPLESALEVTGDVTITLWVETTCLDTDFTARLIDEYPAGTEYPAGLALNLLDWIVRLRYRNGLETAELAEPGEVYELVMEPKTISNVFAVGHRIRLDVSSSNSPQFDVNPNTGGRLGVPTGFMTAWNTVFHNAHRASRVTLPVAASGRSAASEARLP